MEFGTINNNWSHYLLLALMAEIGPKWREDTAAHVDMMVTAFSEVLKLASLHESIQGRHTGPGERP